MPNQSQGRLMSVALGLVILAIPALVAALSGAPCATGCF